MGEVMTVLVMTNDWMLTHHLHKQYYSLSSLSSAGVAVLPFSLHRDKQKKGRHEVCRGFTRKLIYSLHGARGKKKEEKVVEVLMKRLSHQADIDRVFVCGTHWAHTVLYWLYSAPSIQYNRSVLGEGVSLLRWGKGKRSHCLWMATRQ